jgi:hypothetical protein
MRVMRRDGPATFAVAAGLVVYAMWYWGAIAPSTRVLAAAVFACGWVACNIDREGLMTTYGARQGARPPMPYVIIASVFGAVALTAGIAAMITGSEFLLAALVVALMVLWALSTARHVIHRPS